MFKGLLPFALLIGACAAFADERKVMTFFTDVETFSEAKARLGHDNITESDLLRTHYLFDKDPVTKKVTIRTVEPTQYQQNTALR
ncbi:MAG TPA: hypothetical protein DCR13_01820 [Gammaproteobacteria bacterium]|nr:hypothetical protein [Gammaproteobacteria bacterium]